MSKFQIPNSKFQINHKFQIPKSQPVWSLEFWSLEFVWYLVFGIWYLSPRFKLGNREGFTLIELLVTLAIFSTVMAAAANIFVYTQKAQRRTEAKQATQTDARFALEVMQRQARAGRIDYSAYGGAISGNPQTVLALVNPAGAKVRFRLTAAAGRGEIQMSQDGGASWSALTPPDLSVESLAFYLAPATDPFAASPATDRSPLTTIVMSTISLSEGGGDAPTFLQTSVSSRQYLR